MPALIKIAKAIKTLPYKIPRAVFWSSSISFFTENGETFTISQKVIAKTTMPTALNDTTCNKLSKSIMKFPPINVQTRFSSILQYSRIYCSHSCQMKKLYL